MDVCVVVPHHDEALEHPVLIGQSLYVPNHLGQGESFFKLLRIPYSGID